MKVMIVVQCGPLLLWLAATAVVPGSAFSAGRLPTDDMGLDAGKCARQERHFQEERIAIAKDRPKWRQQAHSKPKPPDA